LNSSAELTNAKLKQFGIAGIEITNLEQVKACFGNTFAAFWNGFKKFLDMEAAKHNAEVKIINDSLIVLAFKQNETLYESCNVALETSISTVQLLNKINQSIKNPNNTGIKVKIGVSISSILDRRGIARYERSIETQDDISIIVHPLICKYVGGKYKFDHLVSIFIDNQLTPYYQLNWESVLIKQGAEKPANIEQEANYWDEDRYDAPEIKFEKRKRLLATVDQAQLQKRLEEIVLSVLGFNFINVVTDEQNGKIFGFSFSEMNRKLKGFKWLKIAAQKDDEICPYGLIRKIIRALLEIYTISPDREEEKYFVKQTFFTLLGPKIQELENLILLEQGIKKDIEEIRENLFNQVALFLNSISAKQKTVIVIEDFHNIDRASIDCLNHLFDNQLIKTNLIFLVSSDYKFNLSQHFNRINENSWYIKIKVRKDSYDNVSQYVRERVADFERNFLIGKMIQNSSGSLFYIKQSLNYLIDHGILREKSGIFKIMSEKIVPIPLNVEDLLYKRLSLLVQKPELSDFYLVLMFLGPTVKYDLLKYLYPEGVNSRLNGLLERSLIEILEDTTVLISNYNLFKQVALNVFPAQQIERVIKFLIHKFALTESTQHPLTFEFFRILQLEKQRAMLLNNFTDTCLLAGDISAYIKCNERIIDIVASGLEEFPAIIKPENKEQYSMIFNISEQIGEISYEIYPDIAITYLKKAIRGAELAKDKEKIIKLTINMVKACNSVGKYNEALNYIGKIISLTSSEAFNIASKNFKPKYYLLNYIKVQVLYNIGKLKDCLDLINEVIPVFETIKNKDLLADNRTSKFINEMINDLYLYKARCQLLIFDADFDNTLKKLTEYNINNAQFADLLDLGRNICRGVDKQTSEKIATLSRMYENSERQPELGLYANLFNIFAKIQQGRLQEAANIAYSTKQIASRISDIQIACLMDLVIGLSYKMIGNHKKALRIYNDVLAFAADKSLQNVMFTCWYLLADLEFATGKGNNALEIVNKSCMLLEPDNNYTKLFLIYFKILQAKLLKLNKNMSYAQNSAQQALLIAETHGLKYHKVLALMTLAEITSALTKSTKDKAQITAYKAQLDALVEQMNKDIRELENSYILGKVRVAIG